MSNSKSRMVFAKQMRKFRNRCGMTIEKLSEETGLSYNYLSAVENGRNNISVDNAERIALALDIDLAVLFIREKDR